MKHTLCILAVIAGLLFANSLTAQTDSTTQKKKKRSKTSLSITLPSGLSINKTDTSVNKAGVIKDDSKPEKKDPLFKTGMTIVDLGFNVLKDNTNYASPAVKTFLNVPANRQNASLFDLRQGKSINVNVYPLMVRFKALHTPGQRIYISSGLGLQLYNFRYEDPITYTRNPSNVIIDSNNFKKDKLAMDYLNVPLMFTFKTRIYRDPKGRYKKDQWLVYGAGLTEGYLIDSWTKQVSGEFGKVKFHDSYGLTDFNTCITAEFGIEDMFRFYATYQLTSLYTTATGLDQHPFSFGIRLTGL